MIKFKITLPSKPSLLSDLLSTYKVKRVTVVLVRNYYAMKKYGKVDI
jgi:hypothetical protein